MRKRFPDLDPDELTPDREEKRSLREMMRRDALLERWLTSGLAVITLCVIAFAVWWVI